MSEIPIEIDLPGGVLEAAAKTPGVERKKTQLFNAAKLLSKEYVSSSVKSQMPYKRWFHRQGRFGIKLFKKALFHCLTGNRNMLPGRKP
jgi:hypothetical protein